MFAFVAVMQEKDARPVVCLSQRHPSFLGSKKLGLKKKN